MIVCDKTGVGNKELVERNGPTDKLDNNSLPSSIWYINSTHLSLKDPVGCCGKRSQSMAIVAKTDF